MVIKMKLGLCDFIVFILVLVSVHAVEKAMQTECVGPQCGQVNAAEVLVKRKFDALIEYSIPNC